MQCIHYRVVPVPPSASFPPPSAPALADLPVPPPGAEAHILGELSSIDDLDALWDLPPPTGAERIEICDFMPDSCGTDGGARVMVCLDQPLPGTLGALFVVCSAHRQRSCNWWLRRPVDQRKPVI